MEREYKWMVCTHCFTYNQAPYIEETMNGFTMQETTFPVVTLIMDDASTDGEPEVIRQYLVRYFKEPYRIEETDYAQIICAHHINNHNCTFVAIFLNYNHYSIRKNKHQYLTEWADYSKYHALCEGDDYWTEPRKLQMQIDYLESHDNCNLVYTDVSTLCQKDGTIIEGFFNRGAYRHIKNTHKDIVLWGWFMAPCTWVYRNGIIQYPKELSPNMFYGDVFYLLSLSENGTIHFINKRTAVYRVLEESASHSSNPLKKFDFWKKGRATRLFFASKQSLAFRIKWLFVNESLAVRNILRNRNYMKTKKTFSMIFEEIRYMFFH